MKMTNRVLPHFGAACRCSAAGLVSTFKREAAFRQEIALAVPHFSVLYLVGFPVWAWVVLTALLGLVVVTELLNTAIECVVDLVSPDYHELAKLAKDAASAAVSICLIVYFVSWGAVAMERFL